MEVLWQPDRNKRATHTTPFSQMTLMRSWIPGSPWGIFVKSSLPMALCLMVNGRWSDPTTFRVSLRPNRVRRKVTFITAAVEETGSTRIILHFMWDFIVFPSLSQQAHQEIGSIGVQAKRRHGNVGSSMGPVLMIVLHAVQHSVGCGCFTVDHLTCGQTVQYGCTLDQANHEIKQANHDSL